MVILRNQNKINETNVSNFKQLVVVIAIARHHLKWVKFQIIKFVSNLTNVSKFQQRGKLWEPVAKHNFKWMKI